MCLNKITAFFAAHVLPFSDDYFRYFLKVSTIFTNMHLYVRDILTLYNIFAVA